MTSPLHTPICDLFGCEFPIVQTGMGWVSGARLTAATSAAGGLGILASATMTFAELVTAIQRVKERTDKPFGVNLRADQDDAEQRIELLIREGVRVASFAGPPNRGQIETLKGAGLITMPTVGLKRHAEKMQQWGCDAIIAQGHEGGGHTGPIPTSILLPQCSEVVDIPVLGAGGFRDGRGLVAALAWGAQGIAMGTRFLLTQESHVPEAIKARYLKTDARGTVVTEAVDGWPQRVVRTEMIETLERSGTLRRLWRSIRYGWRFRKMQGTSLLALFKEGRAMKEKQGLTWSQVMMAANAPMMTRASLVDGQEQLGILPTGQVTGAIDELPTVADLLARIVAEAEDTLARLCPGSSAAPPSVSG